MRTLGPYRSGNLRGVAPAWNAFLCDVGFPTATVAEREKERRAWGVHRGRGGMKDLNPAEGQWRNIIC